ncbi:MAG: MFS transporter [Desulfobacterales bacterium]|nr:MFS transporter [Desulfobacterales bacterium]
MAHPSSLHPAWIMLAICFVNLFVNYSVRLGYGVVLPEMIRELGLSRTAGGSIYNAYLLTYILVAPFTGYLTDRLGARRVISVCLLLLAAGVLLLGSAEKLWAACVAFGITGLGASGLWVPVITLVQRWFSIRRKGLALGIMSTGYGLGFAVMGVVFPWVVEHFNWRYAWYFLGLAALLLALPNAALLRSDPADRGRRPWGPQDPAPLRPAAVEGPPSLASILRQRNFWIIGASYFCLSYGLYGFTTFMVDFAVHQLQFPIRQASLLATVHGLFQIAGVLIVLPLSDLFGRKHTILVSNAVITLLLAALVPGGVSWPALCAITAAMAVFYGATFPIYGACAGDYFPRQAMGTVAGAWTPFYGLGAILTHWISGAIRDTTGRYEGAFLACALMAACALAFMGLVKTARPDAAAASRR